MIILKNFQGKKKFKAQTTLQKIPEKVLEKFLSLKKCSQKKMKLKKLTKKSEKNSGAWKKFIKHPIKIFKKF